MGQFYLILSMQELDQFKETDNLIDQYLERSLTLFGENHMMSIMFKELKDWESWELKYVDLKEGLLSQSLKILERIEKKSESESDINQLKKWIPGFLSNDREILKKNILTFINFCKRYLINLENYIIN